DALALRCDCNEEKDYPPAAPGFCAAVRARRTTVRNRLSSLCLVLLTGAGLLTALTVLTTLTVLAVPAGAAPDSAAAANPATYGPFDPRIELDGHWGRDDDVAITVNSGSSVRFRFAGSHLGALFDTSSITVP